MNNPSPWRKVLVSAALSLALLPLSGVAIYALTEMIGPEAFGAANHLLRQAFESVDLSGSPFLFSWSWESILIAIYGIPHAVLVFTAGSILKQGSLYLRGSVQMPLGILAHVCAACVAFVFLLVSWRVLVDRIPVQWFAAPPAIVVSKSRLFSHIALLFLISLPYALMCILLVQLIEALASNTDFRKSPRRK